MAAAVSSSSSSSLAAALLSFSSRSWFASLFSPNPPHLLLFSTSRSFATRTHALRPVVPSTAENNVGEYGDGDSSGKSRNDLKREARRAVRWGMDLAAFSPLQIKRILRAAALEREVLDAIMLIKRLGPDVREGKRRQFNYIGRLLRKAQPELMDALIQASKDGDTSRLQVLSGQETPSVDDNEVDEEDSEEDIEFEEEESGIYLEVADKWFDGLIYKDPSITSEVYSVQCVDFDRQELRRLVRQVQSIKDVPRKEEIRLKGDAKLIGAKSLIHFLRSLAKKSLTEA